MMNMQHNISLLPYNTFHIDCIATHFADVHTQQDFLELLETDEWKNADKKFFLGGGSNILFTEQRFEGLVIRNNILGKEIREAEDSVYVKVGAGENRDEFVRRTLKNTLYGVENLVSIPGNVGAAPIQNIGAYGIEVKDLITEVGGINIDTKQYSTLSGAECQFGYRDSIFKHGLKDRFFVTDVTFRLHRYLGSETYKANIDYGSIKDELDKQGVVAPTPAAVAHTIAFIRASKLPDPKIVGTAGSFFKNVYLTEKQYQGFLEKLAQYKPALEAQVFPIQNSEFKIQNYKIPSGRILDQVLGYRGHREGDVGCRPQQALCIVNYDKATGPQIVQFSERLQKECEEKLGISIEPEVNFIS